MIHPARFLFDAGATPKEWNQKMLNDPHLKVLFHEQESSKVFANTDIKGGVAITYRFVFLSIIQEIVHSRIHPKAFPQ